MKTSHRRQAGETLALLSAISLGFVELLVLHSAPAAERPLISGVLLAAALPAFALTAAVVYRRRRGVNARARQCLWDALHGSWIAADALEGFPMEAVRPMLLGPDAPSLGRLYLAWIFATYGKSSSWINRRLDVPPEVIRVLVDAVQQRN